MNSEQRFYAFVVGCISVCATTLFIFLAINAKGCSQSDDGYKKDVLTKCLDKGLDPLACEKLVGR